jgi:hypothetical protein
MGNTLDRKKDKGDGDPSGSPDDLPTKPASPKGASSPKTAAEGRSVPYVYI